MGGQNWQACSPRQTPTPGEGEVLVLLEQPQPQRCVRERAGSVLVKSELSLSASQGFSLCLGSGPRVDQAGLPTDQRMVAVKPYSQLG